MIFRGFSFRLAPTPEQAILLGQIAGVVRLTYNLALEQRRDHWRQYLRNTGKRLNWAAQSLELTALRREYDWMGAAPRECAEQALRDLERAFANFFAGRARYPTPRRRGLNDSFLIQGRSLSVRALNAKWGQVKLPGVGWVKYRSTRPLTGKLLASTVTHTIDGWSMSFGLEMEALAATALPEAVGIDRGVANTLSLSNGEHFQMPASVLAVAKRRGKAQKVLARKKRGSARYARQRARVARLRAREARIRRDWSHRVTTGIVRRFGVVGMEALKIKNMTASAAGTVEVPGTGVAQKRGLNRSILHQGWGQIAAMLEYKLEAVGGHLLTCNPAYTSQTCSSCGTIDRQSRESQASYVCRHCGFADHADTNAAKNILRQSMSGLDVEGHQIRPCEASTTALAA